MTNPQQNALAEALERKMARVHPSNRKADLPMMIKMTYGDLETIVQALASNNPAAVEGQGEAVAFDILWPLQEWDGREDVCRAAARAVTAALASNSGGED